MSGFLIDTNVISEILRPKPEPRVLAWTEKQPKERLLFSVISVGELRKGLTILPPSVRRDQLEQAITQHLTAWFAGRILPVTESIAERWGVLGGRRHLEGRPLSVPDGQIAASALEHALPLLRAMYATLKVWALKSSIPGRRHERAGTAGIV